MKNFKNLFPKRINLLGILTVILIVVIPLVPKFPILAVPGTYVAIRFEDFLMVLVGIILLFYLLPKMKVFFKDNLNLAIVFYLVVVGISLILAILFTRDVVIPHIGLLHWVRRVEYFLPFFVALFAVTSVRKSLFFIVLLIGTSFFVFLYGIGQLYFRFPLISTTNEEFSKGLLLPLNEGARVNSTFAGQFDLAAFLAIILCLSSVLILGSTIKIGKTIIAKIIIFLLSVASYWLLLQSGSRISLFAFLFGAISGLFILKKRLSILILIFLCSLGIFIPSETSDRFKITIEQNLPKIQKVMKQSFLTSSFRAFAQETATTSEEENLDPRYKATITAKTERPAPGEPSDLEERIVFRSQGIRFNVEWPRAIRAFLKNPLFGTGVSSISLATDNDYLRSLGETGIIGFLAFVAIFAEILRRVFAFFKRENEELSRVIVASIFGVIVAMLVNASFIDIFEASKIAIIFWILAGILVKTISLSIRK
jgi:hypothetical protein